MDVISHRRPPEPSVAVVVAYTGEERHRWHGNWHGGRGGAGAGAFRHRYVRTEANKGPSGTHARGLRGPGSISSPCVAVPGRSDLEVGLGYPNPSSERQKELPMYAPLWFE